MSAVKVPDILTVEPFEVMRERFINDFFYPHAVKEVGEEMAQLLTTGLRSPNESAALLLDSMILFRQQETRNDNYKYLQNFSETATDSEMIDLVVSRLGLTRQVIQPADNTVFPPIPAVMESDASLLLRYSLAPYGLATTGTRTGYKFHAMTLGERPLITVYRESENVIIQRFEFTSTEGVTRPKDAEARMVTPNSGEVQIRVLSPIGDGSANQALQDAVLAYCSRPDVAQESDHITTASADINPYSIAIDAWEETAPTRLIDREGLNKALSDYAEEQHKLGGTIQRSRIDQIAHNHNATRLNILSPASDVACDWFEAPYCQGVTVNVRTN
ncbi:baseplate J/gp47 family protein [Vibrio parahaemolyticus]|uniref:baseplate J/gp47 family protein n=1 Tax=Vibrio parahaemolyticus TaxID=670 RepID=UPI00226AAADA|nr:baseplate J/gp47 family protein [Vibrio parahaemolyticus]MCX8936232.1 baseplate J/gp47 family protein [Vibrio parahaemolyticus]